MQPTHDTFGRHILLDVWDVDYEALNDLGRMKTVMKEAARAAGATIVDTSFHRFPVQGLSGVVVLAESHISVHTFPEHGYASFDVFTCGTDIDPNDAMRYIVNALATKRYYTREFVRGTDEGIVERVEQPLRAVR